MAFIQILLVVNLISSAWGYAVYVDCNGDLKPFESQGCNGCSGKLVDAAQVMGAVPVKDPSIITAAVNATKPGSTVKLTFALTNVLAGLSATGGSWEVVTDATPAGVARTEGCNDDNMLVNWGLASSPPLASGNTEITWTAPSTPGFEVSFLAYTGTSYGNTKIHTFKIGDIDGVAAPTPAPTAKTVDTTSSSTSTGADDSGSFRVEIPMAFMITLFIGLLKF